VVRGERTQQFIYLFIILRGRTLQFRLVRFGAVGPRRALAWSLRQNGLLSLV
jgi:hypothetical protein